MTIAILRRARLARGITAKHVAALLGISKCYLSQMERGSRTINPERLKAYRKAIGLKPLGNASVR